MSAIAAIATGEGGAIAIIRVSGVDAFRVCDAVFSSPNNRTIANQTGFSLLYGFINDGDRRIDDVLVSVFRAPHSYTGENMVEISCHASSYIKQEIMRLLLANGATLAQAGEFTLRAFLNGKLDLAQAEAVADIISSENKESHTLAINQIRGGYSEEFKVLRDKLLTLSSLLELELDFSEEDVEFADRAQLSEIMRAIANRINELKDSFALGNAIKNGIPVAIAGSPNVGKSTLLNALLKEDKAMVSDIAGTTRDVIEDVINIDGLRFRFIDTAGIRHTDDVLESMGIERTFERIEKASVILYVSDITTPPDTILTEIKALNKTSEQTLIIVLNKSDKVSGNEKLETIKIIESKSELATISISAKNNEGIQNLTNHLSESVKQKQINSSDIIVTNLRHYEALEQSATSIDRAAKALSRNLPPDLLAQETREILHHIGTITGEITTDDILGNIFSKFCIGK